MYTGAETGWRTDHPVPACDVSARMPRIAPALPLASARPCPPFVPSRVLQLGPRPKAPWIFDGRRRTRVGRAPPPVHFLPIHERNREPVRLLLRGVVS